MYKNYKIIVVTPAGRERYLKILMPFILNSELVDEYHLWENTKNQADIDFLRTMSEKYDKIKVIKPHLYAVNGNQSIGQFFSKCIDPDTIYIRFDDDVVFIENHFFEKLLDFRINHREYFLIFPNIINNAICSYILQQYTPFIDKSIPLTPYCLDSTAWKEPKFAEYLHERFFLALEKNKLDLLKFSPRKIALARFSINCICWFGYQFAEFGGVVPVNADEEQFLSVDKPLELNMNNCIFGEVLVCHYSFYTQREYLEQTKILERYKAISEQLRGEI